MDGEGGVVIMLFVIGAIIIILAHIIGFITNTVEIILGFINSYSIWFYSLGGLLIVYVLFLQAKVQKRTVEKEKIDRLSKSLNAQSDQSQQKLNQQWRDWES